MTSEQDIKKIRQMMAFLVKQKISEKINKFSSNEKKIYDLTGKKQNDIIKQLGVSSKTVTKLWKEWEDEGILIKEGQSYKKLI